MTSDSDLAERLKELIKPHESVLDVGCKYGQHLFPFLNLGFKHLHGIDNSENVKDYIPFYYLRYKHGYDKKLIAEVPRPNGIYTEWDLTHRKLKSSLVQKYWPKSYSDYLKYQFDIGPEEGDVLNYVFTRMYDLIIVSNLLHFFNKKERLLIVNKLYNQLNQDGLIYIYANTEKRALRYSENF